MDVRFLLPGRTSIYREEMIDPQEVQKMKGIKHGNRPAGTARHRRLLPLLQDSDDAINRQDLARLPVFATLRP